MSRTANSPARCAARSRSPRRGALCRLVRPAAVLALLLLPVQLGTLGCGCDLEIITSALPDGTVNVPYSFELDSHCGGDDWFIANGDLPPGIGLLSNGILRGVPSSAGRFTFTVGVADFGSGDEAFKGLTLTIHAS